MQHQPDHPRFTPGQMGGPPRGAPGGQGGRGGRGGPRGPGGPGGPRGPWDPEKESKLVEMIKSNPDLRGKPEEILKVMDQYKADKFLMTVGNAKGAVITDLIRERKPKLILELGAYVGYSAVAFARHLPDMYPDAVYPKDWSAMAGENKAGYISLELNETFAGYTQTAVDWAGLADVFKIIVGPSSQSLTSLRKVLNMPKPLAFDMIFIDHHKPIYVHDLKILEDEGLIKEGTCIIADNVTMPGIPDYLSYVRATPTQKKATEALGPLSSVPDYTPHPENADGWRTLFFDGPTDETRFPHPDAGGVKAKGDSSIIYRTEMIGVDQEGGDRFDALEVSTVIGYERD